MIKQNKKTFKLKEKKFIFFFDKNEKKKYFTKKKLSMLWAPRNIKLTLVVPSY